MNSVHEQCPLSDSETVLSQKLAMCTATAQPAHPSPAHVAMSQPSQRRVVGAQPAVSQRIGAVSQRRAHAPACCAPRAALPLAHCPRAQCPSAQCPRAQRPCTPPPTCLCLRALCRSLARPYAQRQRRVAGAVVVLQYSLSYLPHLVTIQLGSSLNPFCTFFFFSFLPATGKYKNYIPIFIFYFFSFSRYSNKFIKIYFLQFSSILQLVKP